MGSLQGNGEFVNATCGTRTDAVDYRCAKASAPADSAYICTRAGACLDAGYSITVPRVPPEAKRKENTSGPSSLRLAEALVREPELAKAITDPTLRLLSYTFTIGGSAFSSAEAITATAPMLLAAFEKLAGAEAGLLVARDVPAPDGRHHLHGLALVSARFASRELLRAWRSLPWESDRQPEMSAQHVRPVRTHEALRRVLAHHLGGRRRHGLDLPELGTTWQRTHACGALRGPWERVAARLRLPGAALPLDVPKLPSRASKASAPTAPPRRARVQEGCCSWCGNDLGNVARAHARFHSACRRERSRALKAARQPWWTGEKWLEAFRNEVEKLEARGWRTHDAINERIHWGGGGWLCPFCKQRPRARRVGAGTCGDPRCIARLKHRTRCRPPPRSSNRAMPDKTTSTEAL